MENLLWRNDDISWDSDIDQLISIQKIFEKHGQKEVYSVVPFGRAIYDSDNYSHDMPLSELENIIGDKPLSSNQKVVQFLKDSIGRGHGVSMHGWKHTRVTDYEPEEQLERMLIAKSYLEELLETEVQYFVPPFNHYNRETIMVCETANLPMSQGGGQLEKLIDEERFEPHSMYWYHYYRFFTTPGLSLERLDDWLTRLLYRIQ